MGSTQSSLTPEEIAELRTKTKFDEMEIKQLQQHFDRLAATKTNDAELDEQEFCEALGFPPKYPLAVRLFHAFDKDNSGFDSQPQDFHSPLFLA